MSVIIRSAQPSDQDSCIALLARLGEPEISAHPDADSIFQLLLTEERGQILVAIDNGSVVGMAASSFNLAMRCGAEYCQLEELIVDPSARGKNIGGLLVEHTIATARDRGCTEVGLYLVNHTSHNQPFYEKYGFQLVGSEMRQAL